MADEMCFRGDSSIGSPIVGNYSSLTTLSSEPDSKLQLVSKAISDIILRGTEDVELVINQVLLELDATQDESSDGTSFLGVFKARNRVKLVRKYEALLARTDEMSLALKLQQAALTKETIMLKKLEPTLEKCIAGYEMCISKVEEISSGLQQGRYANQVEALSPKEWAEWQARLEGKVETIRVSHTVAMQTLAQTKLLRENNQQIIDRITSAVINTIPIWRNQIIMALNIERLKSEISAQQQLASTINLSVTHVSKRLKKTVTSTSKAPIDKKKLKKINHQLSEVLNNLMMAERAEYQSKQLLAANLTEQE